MMIMEKLYKSRRLRENSENRKLPKKTFPCTFAQSGKSVQFIIFMELPFLMFEVITATEKFPINLVEQILISETIHAFHTFSFTKKKTCLLSLSY